MTHRPKSNSGAALLLGLCLLAGLGLMAKLATDTALQIKAKERTVRVKGLSEREVPADSVIWPIKFTLADNDLATLYTSLQEKNRLVIDFLKAQGFNEETISVAAPKVIDRKAEGYNAAQLSFRYSGSSTITVVTGDVTKVRTARSKMGELGQQGLALGGQAYEAQTEFLFTGLNEIKPAMIEDATRNAREVAQKFAQDSNSQLGKIKRASQGQFSIRNRDSNTPHIKKVRVVSTVEYYLID